MCVYSVKALSKVQSMHEVFPHSAIVGFKLVAIHGIQCETGNWTVHAIFLKYRLKLRLIEREVTAEYTQRLSLAFWFWERVPPFSGTKIKQQTASHQVHSVRGARGFQPPQLRGRAAPLQHRPALQLHFTDTAARTAWTASCCIFYYYFLNQNRSNLLLSLPMKSHMRDTFFPILSSLQCTLPSGLCSQVLSSYRFYRFFDSTHFGFSYISNSSMSGHKNLYF